MMRGYRNLRRTHSLARIQDIQQEFRSTPFEIRADRYSTLIFGSAICQAELITRQTVSSHAYTALTRALLITSAGNSGKVRLAIPSVWRRLLEVKGFRVDHLWCKLSWAVFVFRALAYGIAQILINLASSCSGAPSEKDPPTDHVFFCDLVSSNIPAHNADSKSYNIINWFCAWSGRPAETYEIRHTVPRGGITEIHGYKIAFRRSPVPLLQRGMPQLRYLYWSLRAITIASVSFLCGRWWNVLQLRESATSSTIRLNNPNRLASHYFFHNSRFYRPLWTYEVESLGKHVIYYFYSTNNWPGAQAEGSRLFCTPYSIMNWPWYLVWDGANAEFVRRCDKHAPRIDVVGPIWFTSGTDTSMQFSRSVAVFDVQPVREVLYRRLGLPSEYYVPDSVITFLSDISRTTSALSLKMVWKRKREIGKDAHPRYRSFSRELSGKSHIFVVDPGTSAFEVVKGSTAVISMPFTSTALIAKSLGKPSVYYDPTGTFMTGEIAASGISVINDANSLAKWLRTVLNEPSCNEEGAVER